MYIEKCELFKRLKKVRKKVAKSFSSQYIWMVAFKIYIFDASFFEEMPNRGNAEILRIPFIINVFSNTLKVVQECPPFISSK